MNVSEYMIEFLGNLVAGDAPGLPYRSGPQLVKFFNQFGARDVYPSGGGFPTRRIYAQEKVRELNGSAALKKVIEKMYAATTLADFLFETKSYQKQRSVTVAKG